MSDTTAAPAPSSSTGVVFVSSHPTHPPYNGYNVADTAIGSIGFAVSFVIIMFGIYRTVRLFASPKEDAK